MLEARAIRIETGLSKVRSCLGVCNENGEPGGTRTRDHRIKSAMLYQLSYRPINNLRRLGTLLDTLRDTRKLRQPAHSVGKMLLREMRISEYHRKGFVTKQRRSATGPTPAIVHPLADVRSAACSIASHTDRER